MEIGKTEKIIEVEPIEDPFKRSLPERTPARQPERVETPTPERVPERVGA